MRSGSYRNNRLKAVIQLIILIILALLVYFILINPPHEHSSVGDEWKTDLEPTCTENGHSYQVCQDCEDVYADKVIPATGHTNAVRKENEIASTCTKGGSYDKVTYCRVCDVELAREKVQVELKAHTPSTPFTENRVESTHASAGTYEKVVKCRVCKVEMERTKEFIYPLGHEYDWELIYDDEVDEFRLVGTCECNEVDNVFTYVCDPESEIEIDDSTLLCCRKVCIATATVRGELVVESVEVEQESHYIVFPGKEWIRIPIDNYSSYDSTYGKYYMYDYLKDVIELTELSEWDKNGFSYGIYQCVDCIDHECSVCNGAWFRCTIYSAEYDTRLQSE